MTSLSFKSTIVNSLLRECEKPRAGARRAWHGALSINQVRDEMAATEMVRSGQILGMILTA